MDDAPFLQRPARGFRRSVRLQRQIPVFLGEPPSEILAQYGRNRGLTRKDVKHSVTCEDSEEELNSGIKSRSAQKRLYSQLEQTESDAHDGTKPFKKTLIVTLKLKSLVQDRRFRSKYIDNQLLPYQMITSSSSEDDTTSSFSPSPSPSSYRESLCSEQSPESTAGEADRNTSVRTPSPTSSPVTGTFPLKSSSHLNSTIAPPKIPTLQQAVDLAITLEQQKRTILRVSLLSGSTGYVPLRLRSCMSLSAFFTSVSTASGLSGDGGSAIANIISATFDWKAETDIDRMIHIRRDLEDSFDIFLRTVAEDPIWEQEGSKCGIAVAVVDT